jgi:hypothetical protein
MGTITRSFANNITTSGILLPASLNNNSIANVTAYNASIATGNMVLISSQTASASSSISFTTGIDSTYKEYQFHLINVHCNTDDTTLGLNFTTDGTNFNVTKTTTFFRATQKEDGTSTGLNYRTNADLAQSTSDQVIGEAQEGESDSNISGILTLFNPSSTTYVKHFIMNVSCTGNSNLMENAYIAGYANTTSAVTGVRFAGGGTTLDGTILLYGIV